LLHVKELLEKLLRKLNNFKLKIRYNNFFLIIITGDFNVVNNEIDMWNPETYRKHKSPGIFKE